MLQLPVVLKAHFAQDATAERHIPGHHPFDRLLFEDADFRVAGRLQAIVHGRTKNPADEVAGAGQIDDRALTVVPQSLLAEKAGLQHCKKWRVVTFERQGDATRHLAWPTQPKAGKWGLCRRTA